MTTRMLIDARHPEETRIAVVNGSRIEEFDFEAAAKKQIKGNIYLAKVTRVEPSLQAAFIDYGGNRHGFLAFSEIHPDYYQIPREDRERLLREEAALEHEAHDAPRDNGYADDGYAEDVDYPETRDEPDAYTNGEDAPPAPIEADDHHDDHQSDRLRERRMALRRRYKIQDVIKRRQVMLIQVVKEERGNKGAALTTYLSLAGRYCVLMPNTSHGGGISRKISSMADRRRLKQIMEEMRLPAGMGAIVRTAGLSRSKTEIKRDFDYLTRLWDDIREATLTSTAPALIHADSDLIKRAIRDVYGRAIEEVLVEGEEGYRHARAFMKMLMPSHAKNVKQYVDPIPLFQRGQVEGQLNAMFKPTVQLRSGGYIVINQAEALVAIDINSGRSTREYNIEETAYKTNLEAADEIARQLRLRDLAGLIVIDFIDMDNSGNVRRVERAMKDALESDRARIQVGRISSFGLLEMSRQRLRTGVLEASTHICPMCDGAGVVRSVPSAALAAIRGLEEEAVRGRASILTLRAANDVAVYILNRKRAEVVEIEDRYGVRIEVTPDLSLVPPHYEIAATGGPPDRADAPSLSSPVIIVEEDDDYVPEDEEMFDEELLLADDAPPRDGRGRRGEGRSESRREDTRRAPDAQGTARGKRRRRRGGKGRAGEGIAEAAPLEALDAELDAEAPSWDDAVEATADQISEGGSRKRRRRGRRGGKGRTGETDTAPAPTGDLARDDAALAVALDDDRIDEMAFVEPLAPEPVADVAAEDVPKPARKRRATRAKGGMDEVGYQAATAQPTLTSTMTDPGAAPDEPAPKAKRGRKGAAKREADAPAPAPIEATEPSPKPKRGRKKAELATNGASGSSVDAQAVIPSPSVESEPTAAVPASDQGSRKGWWQRTFGS